MDEKNGIGYLGWSQESEVEIADYIPGNDVAKNAGLQKGDILVSVNGQPIRSDSRLYEVIRQTKGAPVELVYSRHGQQHTVTLTPVKREVGGQERWMIGVQPQPKLHLVTTRLSLGPALRESVEQNGKNAFIIVQFLKGMAERRMSTKTIAGPIALGQLSGAAAREGPAEFFGFMSIVSLNLAIFNLLPIPILDGGSILMLLIEIILQRDMSLNVKEAVFKVGFVFIMVIVAFVIYNDISKMLPAG